MAKKIIEITVETERLMVIHRRRRALQARCARCASQVEMVTHAEAALLAGLSPSAVRHLAKTGAIHCGLTAEGEEVVCLKSLCEHAGLQYQSREV
jgi:hypothetical protein